MDNLQTVLWFLLALGILVTFHEFGHFYVARRCGVKVLRFSVGFGNPLWSWTDKKGTQFAIAPIPLGGYVKMVDEREGEVAEEDLPYAFNRQSVWKRMAIVVAGPVANFILAVLFFWVVMIPGYESWAPVIKSVEPGSIAEQADLEPGQEIISIDGVATPTTRGVMLQLINRLGETGSIQFTVKYPDSSFLYTSEAPINSWMQDVEEPDPLNDLGLALSGANDIPATVSIAEIIAGGPAEAAGLEAGDVMVSVDGEEILTWGQLANFISARPDETFELTVEREGRVVSLPVTPRAERNEDGQLVGKLDFAGRIDPHDDMVRRFNYSIPGAFVAAAQETWDTSKLVLVSIKKLILGQISPKNLSGPITIAKVASSSAEDGLIAFLSILALLSVSLGVLNLLPIPVLDGGHLLYFIIEAARGKPVSERVQMIGYQVGLFLVIGIMVLALYNDFGRL